MIRLSNGSAFPERSLSDTRSLADHLIRQAAGEQASPANLCVGILTLEPDPEPAEPEPARSERLQSPSWRLFSFQRRMRRTWTHNRWREIE
jgi:hypothetical protein